jgi:hypothetical protein
MENIRLKVMRGGYLIYDMFSQMNVKTEIYNCTLHSNVAMENGTMK